jgi:hypothetical protein
MMMPICTGSISVDSPTPLAHCSPISVVRLLFAVWDELNVKNHSPLDFVWSSGIEVARRWAYCSTG